MSRTEPPSSRSFVYGIVVCLTSALLPLASVTLTLAQEPVAKVVELHGDWVLYRGNTRVEKLAQWRRLPSQGIIRSSAPSPVDYIVIVDQQDRLLEVRRCVDLSLCTRPIYLPRGATTGEAAARRYDLHDIWERLWEDPARYSLHRSRDIADDAQPHFVEGLASVRGDRLDLSMIARQFTDKPRLVYLQALPDRAPRPAPAGPLRVERDPAGAVFIRVQATPPGLYEIGLLAARPADQQLSRSGSPAWVLVCPASDVDAATASLEAAAGVAQGWAAEVSAGTIQGFLRARLVSLARRACRVSD